jgi:hypothetical protein
MYICKKLANSFDTGFFFSAKKTEGAMRRNTMFMVKFLPSQDLIPGNNEIAGRTASRLRGPDCIGLSAQPAYYIM